MVYTALHFTDLHSSSLTFTLHGLYLELYVSSYVKLQLPIVNIDTKRAEVIKLVSNDAQVRIVRQDLKGVR